MDWKQLSTKIKNKVYYEILITRCYICNSEAKNGLCHHCQKGFAENSTHCKSCKKPTLAHNILCGQCQVSPPTYQYCAAPYLFDGIIKKLIHNIKFNQENYYIRPLTYLLSQHLIQEYAPEDWPQQIIYIPSHPNRIKERGFCQTQVMSKYLITHLKKHLRDKTPSLTSSNPIKKLKNNQAQHSLKRNERLKSPKKSYRVDTTTAKHVALFDDVMTTGSTVEECVKILLKSGVERVDVWVLARTPDKTLKM